MWRNARTIWTIVALLLVLSSLVAAGWLVYLAVAAIATATAKLAGAIGAAVIGLVGTFMAAILNHANQLDAQRKDHANQLEAQRKHAEFLAKQENYKELLSKVGAFARAGSNSTEAGADLSSAHLASWAFGDQEVLEATNKFQNHPDRETLLNLLEAVRDSLDYKDDLPDDFPRNTDRYDPKVLFPPPGTGSMTGFDEVERKQALMSQKQAELDQLASELDQLEAPEAETRQTEEVVNKENSEESETGNRGHTKSPIDTQPGRSPQVGASGDTKMRELPVNGAKPDMGSEETQDESPSHPRWQFWKR